ncbi:MAG: permease [Oceanicaulis sp.]|uniref:TRAP transporter small permease subunit n=1 Tax=unclassified Oceanicaulis TaxID=2632123 RepID=UPI000C41C76F|nr:MULTISPECIES: TRAP transporter small permease subunit [unclassified Oceanicaulis]MAB69021.1 permease [Oceanicaulis sp.]MBC38481.1 permease [Oceanicaulis sp.]MBG35430.1 permease [Oceanicaulis sp.]HBU62976.1 permease [Oceanicaulis sp.]|tara:strand:- start:3154 stop:3936 length:783 start_codon:yes stop_codon:yes gene_type:complete
MKLADLLLLALIGITVLLLGVDAISGGAVGALLDAHLRGVAAQAGTGLGWLGLGLSPFLLIALLSALYGRFRGLPQPVSKLLRRLIALFDAISLTVGDMVRWAALGLVLVTGLIVVQRYVFGVSITKLQESVIYLHAILFLLSSAATLYHGGHVRVDILYTRLSERGKAWTDLLGVYLALIPMCWLILMTSESYVGGAWRILERSRESDGLPLVFLLKTAIPVFAVMMIAQGFAMASRAALTLSGETPPPAGQDDAEHEL